MPAQHARPTARLVLASAVALIVLALARVYLVHPTVAANASELAADTVRDVAIVPGTFASAGRPGPMLRERLEAAEAVLAAGRVRAILVSGNESSRETTIMRQWLVGRGVAPERILVDPAGTRTIATMRNAA